MSIDAGWSADGLGLRAGPSANGDFAVAAEGYQAVAGIFPSGLFTNLLSDRMNGALRSPLLPKNKIGVNLANQIVPIADFTDVSGLSVEDQVRWSVLDTVDMYTPRYDTPMTWSGVMALLRNIGAENVRGDHRSFCFMANAPR